MSESNDQFAKKLYNQIHSGEGNLVMSPFSVSAAMAMVNFVTFCDNCITNVS